MQRISKETKKNVQRYLRWLFSGGGTPVAIIIAGEFFYIRITSASRTHVYGEDAYILE